MGVNLKRMRGSSSFPSAMEVVMVMVALVLLINTNNCGASFVLKSNMSSYRQCINSGAMDDYLIAEDLDLDFDFFMDTYVVRILNIGLDPGTSGIGTPTRIVCYTMEGQQYNCDPGHRPFEHCGAYSWNCWEEVPASLQSDGNGR